jgi:hypothetical protein
MIKPSRKYRSIAIVLLFVLFTQACAQTGLDTTLPALPTARDIEPTSTEVRSAPSATPTVQVEIPTATEIAPTPTSSLPKVSISAVKGNLFIRRGPDMGFNPIDVLYKDTSAKVLARDVLSKWVQIKIPKTGQTGWVSTQTQYSLVEGDLENVPEQLPTEWPVAAYIQNCTYHQMYVMPIEMVIPSILSSPDNEIRVNPGNYTVYDIDVSGEPEVKEIVVKEGSQIEIVDDGSGDHHKCQ